jgi:hypothetical protein
MLETRHPAVFRHTKNFADGGFRLRFHWPSERCHANPRRQAQNMQICIFRHHHSGPKPDRVRLHQGPPRSIRFPCFR